MDNKIAAVALVCVFLAGGTARAQWFGSAMERGTELTAQDLALIRSTVQRDIHGKRVDTVATWNNPATGNSGRITLLRKFARQSRPCEQIAYGVTLSERAAHPYRYVFISCRQPDGTWKLEP